MKYIDLTRTITDHMPVWPGDPAVELRAASELARDGYGVTELAFGSHAGTHMDAPAHLLEGGATLDAMDVARFCGEAAVVDCTGCAEIGEAYLCGIQNVDFVLFYTGWDNRWGAEDYFHSYPVPTAGCCRALAAMGLKGIGFDTPSPDQVDNPGDNHRIILESGAVIVENLVDLCIIKGKRCRLCVLPIKFKGADGAPVRAIAEVL